MEKYIQITRHLYEEPHQLNLVILASNGMSSGGLEFYSNTTGLKSIGEALINFPEHSTAKYLYELGSERNEDNFGYYFRFRVCTIRAGKSHAIQLRLNNNAHFANQRRGEYFELPELSDFYIEIDLDQIKFLGQLLVDFSKLKKQRLFWCPDKAFLDNNLKFKDRRVGDTLEAALLSLPE